MSAEVRRNGAEGMVAGCLTTGEMMLIVGGAYLGGAIGAAVGALILPCLALGSRCLNKKKRRDKEVDKR